LLLGGAGSCAPHFDAGFTVAGDGVQRIGEDDQGFDLVIIEIAKAVGVVLEDAMVIIFALLVKTHSLHLALVGRGHLDQSAQRNQLGVRYESR